MGGSRLVSREQTKIRLGDTKAEEASTHHTDRLNKGKHFTGLQQESRKRENGKAAQF